MFKAPQINGVNSKKGKSLFGNNPFFAVQAKLSVGKAGDSYEKEADAVADQIVQRSESNSFITPQNFFPSTSIQKKSEEENADEIQAKPISDSITPLVQLKTDEEENVQEKCEECEKEAVASKPSEREESIDIQQKCEACGHEEEKIQKKSNVNDTTAINTVEKTLKSTKGNGSVLPPNSKMQMERGFGADFSNVRIHNNSTSAQMNRQLGAQAFTNGNDIYFNSGKFNPSSKSGKHLLAHELTHTIQQGKSINKKEIGQSPDVERNLQSDLLSGNPTLENCLDGISPSYVRYGQNGEPVGLLQQALVDLGYDLPQFGVDGIFLNETLKSVQRFQLDNNLSNDGIVGTLTIDRLDQLHSSFNKQAPEIPIPEIDPAANTCPAQGEPETILADSIKQTPTISTVQAKHLSVEESIGIFSEKINSDEKADPKVTETGQLYWSNVIGEKIIKSVNANTTSMLDPLRVDFGELFILANTNDLVEMNKKMQEIAEKLSKNNSPSNESLKKLLLPSGLQTTANSLWNLFNKENKVTKEVDNLVNYPDYYRIRNEEKTACWSVANFMINRFTSRGGHTKSDPDKRRSAQNKVQAGLIKSAKRNFEWVGNTTKGDVVEYSKDLGATITKMKTALDDGFLIHARVLSGVNFGHGLHPELQASKLATTPPKEKNVFGQAEHSLVIIGYDNNMFLFWDPDSTVSSYKGEKGFGSLFFQSGRLTTAETENELFVNDEGQHNSNKKRYQILSIVSG